MEVFMIKSRFHHYVPPTKIPGNNSSPHAFGIPEKQIEGRKSSNMSGNYTLYSGDDIVFPTENSSSLWNDSAVLFNFTNSTDFNLDYDYQTLNISAKVDEAWGLCNEWTAAQHNLFQTANLFFAAAFLVPMSFKQSVLLIRALLSMGFLFATFWAGIEICALDIMLWNFLIASVNLGHTILLTWRFLPPTLTLELTDLYLKVFKPYKVSKKHFKELVREAKMQNLECGDIYAVEDVSPADERLSILLKGKLRVTCDETHLHFITGYQFIDSPEWEANHEQSDDVFQVTIAAEEDCTYLCWPRMRLERVLRHRPHLKVVMDCIIGKDITAKLYSVNEKLAENEEGILEAERIRKRTIEGGLHERSLSLDAVNTGTTGLVRSVFYKKNQRKPSFSSSGYGSPARPHSQCWQQVVANHFPVECPFTLAAAQQVEIQNQYPYQYPSAFQYNQPQYQPQYLMPVPPQEQCPSSPLPTRPRRITFNVE